MKTLSLKTLIASVFALTLMGATAADAGVGVGVHVGDVHVGVHAGSHHGRHYRHHRPYCVSWGWDRHRHVRYCRRWSR